MKTAIERLQSMRPLHFCKIHQPQRQQPEQQPTPDQLRTLRQPEIVESRQLRAMTPYPPPRQQTRDAERGKCARFYPKRQSTEKRQPANQHERPSQPQREGFDHILGHTQPRDKRCGRNPRSGKKQNGE